MGFFDDIPMADGSQPRPKRTGFFDDIPTVGPTREPAPNAGMSRFDDAAGAAQAGLEGYLSGISGNLRDEIYGLSEASGLPRWLGGFRAPVGAVRRLIGNEEAQKEYERARDEKRAEVQRLEEQYPGMHTT